MTTIINSSHNIGRCRLKKEYPDHKRCCDNYHHCGYQLPKTTMKEAYSGYCFTQLTWKCPECGLKNETTFKIDTPQHGATNQIEKKLKQNISHQLKTQYINGNTKKHTIEKMKHKQYSLYG